MCCTSGFLFADSAAVNRGSKSSYRRRRLGGTLSPDHKASSPAHTPPTACSAPRRLISKQTRRLFASLVIFYNTWTKFRMSHGCLNFYKRKG